LRERGDGSTVAVSGVTVLELDTPHGPARAHLHSAEEPRAALILGHGAAGGVEAPDIVTATEVAHSEGNISAPGGISPMLRCFGKSEVQEATR
jgi:hypothetical protein